MAQTERKQVGKVGEVTAAMVPQVNAPTAPIKGTMHGEVQDLTVNGVGFEARFEVVVAPKMTTPSGAATAEVGDVLAITTGGYVSDVPVKAVQVLWYRGAVRQTANDNKLSYVTTSDDVGAGNAVSCEVRWLDGANNVLYVHEFPPVEVSEPAG